MIINKIYKYFSLLKLIEFTLWVMTGWIVGNFLVNLVTPEILKVEIVDEDNVKKESFTLIQLFGGKTENKVSPSDIKIIGLVAGTADGSIIISFKNGPTQVIKLGEESIDGITFNSFFNNYASFKLDGKIIEVPYVVSKKNLMNN